MINTPVTWTTDNVRKLYWILTAIIKKYVKNLRSVSWGWSRRCSQRSRILINKLTNIRPTELQFFKLFCTIRVPFLNSVKLTCSMCSCRSSSFSFSWGINDWKTRSTAFDNWPVCFESFPTDHIKFLYLFLKCITHIKVWM